MFLKTVSARKQAHLSGGGRASTAIKWRRRRSTRSSLSFTDRRWVKRDGRILKLPFPIYANQEREFENVVIYPATRKVALDDPFFTAYDYFQRTMDACGCCIVIGYSFRDYDALTKLASASIFNPRLKLLVVDPDSENLCKKLSERGIRCTPARQKFGEDVAYIHDVGVHIAEALKNIRSKSTSAP